MNDLISIIIPIYNSEKYLKECIESVIKQSYKNFELILVDDGSKDNSKNICDEYSLKDNRIRVIHKENSGAADSRNKGLEASVGDYVLFMDSDDYWLSEKLLEKLLENSKKYNSDFVLFNIAPLKENLSFSRLFDESYNGQDLNQIVEYLVKSDLFSPGPWNKFFKSSFLKDNKIMFPVGKVCEDIQWTYELMKVAKNISLSNEWYVYRNVSTSQSRNIKEKNIKDYIEIIDICYNSYLSDNTINDSLKNNMLSFLCYEYVVLLGWTWALPSSIRYKYLTKEKEYKFLFKYNTIGKIGKVITISKFLGLFLTSYLLYIFIRMKLK